MLLASCEYVATFAFNFSLLMFFFQACHSASLYCGFVNDLFSLITSLADKEIRSRAHRFACHSIARCRVHNGKCSHLGTESQSRSSQNGIEYLLTAHRVSYQFLFSKQFFLRSTHYGKKLQLSERFLTHIVLHYTRPRSDVLHVRV